MQQQMLAKHLLFGCRHTLQSPLCAAEFLDVNTKEETEGPLTTDDIFPEMDNVG